MSKTEDLFARLQAVYGSRWTACYADEASVDLALAEWHEVVERMSDQQLNVAMSWAKTMCPWPPSMAEFLHAGLGIDEQSIDKKSMKFLTSWDRYRMTNRELEKARRLLRAEALRQLVDERLRPALPGT